MSKPPKSGSLLHTLLEAGSIRIRLFRGRFSPGRHWCIHRKLEAHLLYVFTGGRAILHLEGKDIELASPQVLLLSKGTKYTLTSNPQDPLRFYPIHFTTPETGIRFFQVLDHLTLSDTAPLLEGILTLWQQGSSTAQDGASSGLHALLATMHLLEEQRNKRPTRLQGIDRVCAHLRHHPERRDSVTDLARMAGMGRSNFSAHFTRLTGLSPHQYAIRERCRMAEAMIREEGFRVGEAAAATGYADPFSFSKQFRATLGYPPSQAGNPG